MSFSDHFKKSLKILGLAALLLLVGFLWIRHKIHNIIPPQQVASTLRPSDKEAVTTDFSRHTITVQTPTGSRTEYARNATVRIEKNGQVRINRKLFGFEHAPFLGLGYGDGGGRFQLGVSLLYAYRFDLNAQLAIKTDGGYRTVDPVVSGSYNFYGNTSVFVGTNPIGLIVGLPTEYHVGLIVRF